MNGMESGNGFWMLVGLVIVIVPVWRICTRIGYSGWLSLLVAIPLVNLGLLYFIAFSSWPLDNKVVDNSGQGE